MTKVLFVVTGAKFWTLKDGKKHPTGFWAEELAEPHRIFTEAGWNIDVATPQAIVPTVDKISLGFSGGLPSKRKRIEHYLDSIKGQLDNPLALADVNEADYDLVFYPGGHGPMEDLAHDPVSGALLTKRLDENRPLALLCHGPAAVLAAKKADGTNSFAGRHMTALSDLEERLNTFAWDAEWYLEDAMKEAGIDYEKARLPLRPFVVVDGNLYTGQNPQSADALADRILDEFKRQGKA